MYVCMHIYISQVFTLGIAIKCKETSSYLAKKLLAIHSTDSLWVCHAHFYNSFLVLQYNFEKAFYSDTKISLVLLMASFVYFAQRIHAGINY